jgi:5-methyltetrahydrofolate--homocysteine methyltransferase
MKGVPHENLIGEEREVSMNILEELANAVIAGDVEKCTGLARKAHEEGMDPLKAIQEGLSAGMEAVGRQFECGDLFLPEMMQAAEAMNAGVEVLRPHIEAQGQRELLGSGKVVLATIQGDMHDIGKNIVKILMSTSGFEVVDLGRDVKVTDIVEQADEREADVIGVSALMTTTMGYMPEVAEEMEELGIRDSFIYLVGGAPVTEEWALEIGSDGYAKDAAEAVRVVRDLVQSRAEGGRT